MGIYSILKALTLIQTTLYIHFKGEIWNHRNVNIWIIESISSILRAAVVYTGCFSLLITMIFFISEALYFRWEYGGNSRKNLSW